MCCKLPGKGQHSQAVTRTFRLIKETWLTHFAYRSDRKPAITATIDEACALSGRKGIKVGPNEDVPDHHGLQPGDMVTDGALKTDDLNASDAPHVISDLSVDSTHIAVPELSQCRTLKTALESRLKSRLASDHPVIAWLVEQTAYVMNKCALGPNGKTPYGRRYGPESRERICEFGERIMWCFPKKMRAKLDQRWRYGIFLGRSMASDQIFVGLASGEVVCARAKVRLVPSI